MEPTVDGKALGYSRLVWVGSVLKLHPTRTRDSRTSKSLCMSPSIFSKLLSESDPSVTGKCSNYGIKAIIPVSHTYPISSCGSDALSNLTDFEKVESEHDPGPMNRTICDVRTRSDNLKSCRTWPV